MLRRAQCCHSTPPVRPSVGQSVTLVDCDHTGWNSSKILISRLGTVLDVEVRSSVENTFRKRPTLKSRTRQNSTSQYDFSVYDITVSISVYHYEMMMSPSIGEKSQTAAPWIDWTRDLQMTCFMAHDNPHVFWSSSAGQSNFDMHPFVVWNHPGRLVQRPGRALAVAQWVPACLDAVRSIHRRLCSSSSHCYIFLHEFYFSSTFYFHYDNRFWLSFSSYVFALQCQFFSSLFSVVLVAPITPYFWTLPSTILFQFSLIFVSLMNTSLRCACRCRNGPSSPLTICHTAGVYFTVYCEDEFNYRRVSVAIGCTAALWSKLLQLHWDERPIHHNDTSTVTVDRSFRTSLHSTCWLAATPHPRSKTRPTIACPSDGFIWRGLCIFFQPFINSYIATSKGLWRRKASISCW